MRRIKQLLVMLGHVSTMAWIWSVGGAAVVTTAAGWAAQAQGMPFGWLILGAFGIAVLSFMAIATILAKVFPAWGPEGVLPGPTGTVSAKLIPQGGRIAELEGQLKDQEERNEKLLRLARLAETDRDVATAKAEQVALEKDGLSKDLERVDAERRALHDKYVPPTTPPEPLNKELVIAVGTYGLPAFDLAFETLSNMFDGVRDEPGIGQFVPGLFSDAHGWEAKQHRAALQERIEAGDNGSPFVVVWEAFHRTYLQTVVFWVGRVYYFKGLSAQNAQKLKEWLVIHDKYQERIKELGNAPDGAAVKRIYSQSQSTGAETYRQRIVDAIANPQAPGTAGSPSE